MEDWRSEPLEHRCLSSYGNTVWDWLTEKAKATRDDPGKVVRKIVEREFSRESGHHSPGTEARPGD